MKTKVTLMNIICALFLGTTLLGYSSENKTELLLTCLIQEENLLIDVFRFEEDRKKGYIEYGSTFDLIINPIAVDINYDDEKKLATLTYSSIEISLPIIEISINGKRKELYDYKWNEKAWNCVSYL